MKIIKQQRKAAAGFLKCTYICLIVLCMSLNAVGAAPLPGNDGGNEMTDLPDEYNVVDFNSVTQIVDSGADILLNHSSDGFYSALWNQNKSSTLTFSNVLKDWSSYDYLEIYMYAENAEDTQFMLGPVCYNQPGDTLNSSYFYKTDSEVHDGINHYLFNLSSDFKAARMAKMDNIRDFRFTVGGWGMSVCPEARYYISSIKLIRINRPKVLKENYKLSDLESAAKALKNSMAVYAGSKYFLYDGEKKLISHTKTDMSCELKDGTVAVPVEILENVPNTDIRAENDIYTVTLNNKTARICENDLKYTVGDDEFTFDIAPYKKDDELYIPILSFARAMGMNTADGGELAVIGDTQDISIFNSYGALNDYCEIAEYLITYESMDFSDKTDDDLANEYKEDINSSKKAWKYSLVGDLTNPVDDENINILYEKLDANARNAADKISDGKNPLMLFRDIECISSSNMTSEYQRVYNMALAYGTYGCELYNDEALKNKIIYCLDMLFENRYGVAEAEGRGWRSTSEFNWWDWDIGTPQKLIDILMIMEKDLSIEKISDYLYLFDMLEPKVEATGSNRMDIGTQIIGSALLQGNVKKIFEARDDLIQAFLYCDNGRNNKQGFYTDGSYIFHIAHPMNGTYGIDQLESVGLFLTALHNTSFEYSASVIKNIPQWYYNAYEPLMYQGAVMRMVRGRNEPPAEHKTGVRVLSCMLDMVSALDGEELARFKSIIKTQYQDDKSGVKYYASLPPVKAIKLKNIIDDSSVLKREDYQINKVYNNMDKVVHQRDDFAAGISMSSSRIFGYESCNDQNKRGWYLSDGMTTVYTKDDFVQFSDDYWKNVDPYRLPGITADTQKRDEVSIKTGNEWRSSRDFVGGVSYLGLYGAAAMELQSYNNNKEVSNTSSEYGSEAPAHSCNLRANKAWFMFDDEIVALGSGISASNDVNVLTIVDNCLSDSSKLLSGDGNTIAPYVIVGVEASQTPEIENTAENTLDGQLSTKWAAEGQGDITWDLGEIKTCGYIKLSFMNGNQRQHEISIDTSKDGKSWVNSFKGLTSGTTESPEVYDLSNCNARYIKMTTYGSTSKTSDWTSLTTAAVYPKYEGSIPNQSKSTYIGTNSIIADGEDMTTTIITDDVNLSNSAWVNYNEQRGYYFPEKSSLFARRTEGASSFFELWFDHGINPDNEGYEYVLLPLKNSDETKAYCENPDIEILSNTKTLQAVYEKKLAITAAAFYDAGEIKGIKVDKPLIVVMGEQDGNMKISLCDPTQKLEGATVSFKDNYQLVDGDKNVTQINSKTINIDFAGMKGKTVNASFSHN